MSRDAKSRADQAPAARGPSPGLADRLAGPALLYWLIPALVALSIAGTLVPQNEPAEAYERVFGAWSGAVTGLRLNDVYHAWHFLALLALLAVNLAFCTWKRQLGWGGVRPKAARADVLLTHAGILVVLAGGMVTGFLGRRGNMPLTEGELSDKVRSEGGGFTLPFAVKLDAFRIDTYDNGRHRLTVASRKDGWSESLELPSEAVLRARAPLAPGAAGARPGEGFALRGGAVRVAVLGYYPDFVMGEAGPATRSEAPNNPALRLEVADGQGSERHWAFARFAGFHSAPDRRYDTAYEASPGAIKQFCSSVSILENGRVAAAADIEVNKPLRRKGYTLYQVGYDPDNPAYSNLMVSRDPGVPAVYAGFVLLVAGLAWTSLRQLRSRA